MGLIGEFGAAARDADPDVEPDTFTYCGETFTVKNRVGAMPMLRFAHIAMGDVEAETMEGLDAMYRLITSCVVKADLPRFERVAEDSEADTSELMEICSALYVAVSGRPTSRPSDSADGSPKTGESSKVPSSSKASSSPTWRDSAFGKRELAAHPELYDDLASVAKNGADILALTG